MYHSRSFFCGKRDGAGLNLGMIFFLFFLSVYVWKYDEGFVHFLHIVATSHSAFSPSADSRGAVVSYWQKYVQEVLVNGLGGLSLPRKSVVRLTDCPDMTLDVYNNTTTTTTTFCFSKINDIRQCEQKILNKYNKFG